MDIYESTLSTPSAAAMASATAPQLVDSTAKTFLASALKKSHDIRVKYHNLWWNVGISLVCCTALCLFLYYRYTHKTSPQERQTKLISDQEFVLSKIRYFQEQNQRIQETARTAAGSEITGLPTTPTTPYM